MKTKLNYAKYAYILLLIVGFSSCDKHSVEPEEEIVFQRDDVEDGDFFYHFDEKIIFQQKTAQICLKAVPEIHWEQMLPMLSTPSITVSVAYWTEERPIFLLEAKDKKPIPLETFESFKEMPVVASASYLYQYRCGEYFVILGAHTNEFAVKLKSTTSYERLQALARRNNCRVGEKDPSVKNQYKIYVSRASEFNAIQMSKFFYETGLFEHSSPDFDIINGHSFPYQNPTPFFYYYYGEKLYLQQLADKIYLTFALGTNRERILSIINSDTSLESVREINLHENTPYRITLRTKNGDPIPSATFEFFKSAPEVVSISHLYQFDEQNNDSMALTDMIMVKLKEEIPYEQLLELTEKNNCTIGKKDWPSKNQFQIHVSKFSDLDALQTSNLFYETGLFEHCEPSFSRFSTIGVY